MDLLYSSLHERIQHINVKHTIKVLGDRNGLVFYNVTTLYFENVLWVDYDLRQNGFSKEEKMIEVQIVLQERDFFVFHYNLTGYLFSYDNHCLYYELSIKFSTFIFAVLYNFQNITPIHYFLASSANKI